MTPETNGIEYKLALTDDLELEAARALKQEHGGRIATKKHKKGTKKEI